MKRIRPLVLLIGTSLVLSFSASTLLAEEQSKKKSYKEKATAADSYESEQSPGKNNSTAIKYPLTTRVAPEQKGAPSLEKLRNQMITTFKKEKNDDAIVAADKLKLDGNANNYDKAIATQVKLIILSKKEPDNHKVLIPMIEELLELNALDNDAHYDLMSQLAQRYLIEQDYEDALATSEKFLKETKSETETQVLVSGNALYRLKRLPEAIIALEKVRILNPNNPAALQMLARAYSDSGQNAKAAEINKGLVQSAGNDKASRLNLAINYRDNKEFDKAADVIADLRAQKQMSEERDYMVALNIYQGMKNREKDIVSIVEEGFANNALKPSANLYNALAEAYYYSDLDNNTTKAIANWAKAAPISKDGTVYLNLAIVQCQEEMWAACKESAKNALTKGGINANDAKTQIANADKALGKSK